MKYNIFFYFYGELFTLVFSRIRILIFPDRIWIRGKTRIRNNVILSALSLLTPDPPLGSKKATVLPKLRNLFFLGRCEAA